MKAAPVLLCIDANARTLNRYQPMRDGSRGFLTDRFTMEADGALALGSESFRADLEAMRAGNPAQNKNVPR